MSEGNGLAGAVSPYLLVHARDPVDWQPWGAEAVENARERGVPLFVSIGYSTCHWCHVMARESFRDPEIAAYLNRHFVPVKIDREEHPEVDAHFLAEAEKASRRVGWPLNAAMSPAGEVGFIGTYFPPEPRGGLPAFSEVLSQIEADWRSGGFEAGTQERPAPVEAEIDLDHLTGVIASRFDPVYAGFGAGSKFPMYPTLGFLADRASLGDSAAAEILDRTLGAIIGSALFDVVDGGVFRYATRRDWGAPHFERMLTDNAQLLRLLSIRTAAGALFERAAAGVAEFLGGVLRLPHGGFATAQDSESIVDGRRVEGEYYRLKTDARAEQHAPAIDDKMVAGYNGLAIHALALSGRIFGNSEWIELAEQAASAVKRLHTREDGTLVRATRGEHRSPAPATLEDYGLLASGLLELALATGDPGWARWGLDLVSTAIGHGGFSSPAADPILGRHGTPVLRELSLASGVSAIAEASWKAYLLTAEERFADPVRRLLSSDATRACADPFDSGALLSVLLRAGVPTQQLVTVRGIGEIDSLTRRHYRAGGLVAMLPSESVQSFADAGFSLFEGRAGEPAAYVCEHFVCNLPLRDGAQLRSVLSPTDSRGPAAARRSPRG